MLCFHQCKTCKTVCFFNGCSTLKSEVEKVEETSKQDLCFLVFVQFLFSRTIRNYHIKEFAIFVRLVPHKMHTKSKRKTLKVRSQTKQKSSSENARPK